MFIKNKHLTPAMTNQGFSSCHPIHFSQRFMECFPVHTLLSALLLVSGSTTALPVFANPVTSSLIAQTPPIGAQIIYVNPNTGSDTAGAGSSEATPVRTITYALQQASSGSTVQLAPGSYTADTGEVFPLVVKRGVRLRGEPSTKGQRMAIIGGGFYGSPTLARQNVAIRAERDSEISGITATNPNSRGTALWVESTNPIISNNTFSGSQREGVFLTGTANAKVEDNIFTQNQGNGISVARAATGEIRNNLFQDTGIGISIGDTASTSIVENRILQNVDGVVVTGTATPTLRNNIIESNQRNGVVATSSAQPNLGTADSPGQNRIRNNGSFDLNNATRQGTIVAVGNDIDQSRISGSVDFVAATIPGGTLLDVQGHWAQAYIEALAARDVIAGFPDGTFRPNEPVTRAQFAAIINKAFAPAPERTAINFTDVRNDFWGYQAIQTAYRGNFLSGYPDRTFQPNQRIPRVQALVSLVSGLKQRSDNTSVLSVYNDAGQVPNYALSAIAGATQRQLVVNYPNVNQLNPNREATRAEVAAFVYQALVNSGRAEAIPSPYLVAAP
jgi:parallel beta-helix repeat protein